ATGEGTSVARASVGVAAGASVDSVTNVGVGIGFNVCTGARLFAGSVAGATTVTWVASEPPPSSPPPPDNRQPVAINTIQNARRGKMSTCNQRQLTMAPLSFYMQS